MMDYPFISLFFYLIKILDQNSQKGQSLKATKKKKRIYTRTHKPRDTQK